MLTAQYCPAFIFLAIFNMAHSSASLDSYLRIIGCCLPLLANPVLASEKQPNTIAAGANSEAAQSFQAERISALESERIVRAARFLEQSAANRPQINADFVIDSGAQPAWRIRLDQTTVYFSRPFLNEDGHRLVLAFVQHAGRIDARMFYRSNSQFSWRVCDATNAGHYGKGFHEFDKELPIALTVALHTAGSELLTLQSPTSKRLPSAEVANALLRGLTESASSPMPDKVAITRDGHYWSRDYAAHVVSEPLPWSPVKGSLATAAGLKQADPDATGLPPAPELPDLQHPQYRFSYNNEEFARIAGGQAKVVGQVFMSFDHRLQYLFFSDAAGRVFLSSVELKTAPMTPYAVRANYVNVEGMNAPLMEYSSQIPLIFGGTKRPGYADNWQYVRRQPIVAYYLRELKLSPSE